MKFNIVLGNPPYQAPKKVLGRQRGGTLWGKFVSKAITEWIIDGGYLCFITPAGWRNHRGDYIRTRELLLKNNRMIWLSMYSVYDTQRLFGVRTKVDAYVIKKKDQGLTTIRCDDNIVITKDLRNYKFIPNSNFELYESLLAKENEPHVEIVYSASNYDPRRLWVNKDKTKENVYPVIIFLRKNKDHYVAWSSRNDKGHFGIPKVIFCRGDPAPPVLIDYNGQYGMSSDASAITDDLDNLDKIAKVLESKKFLDFMKSFMLSCGGVLASRNKDALELFRKDFWMDFI